MNRYNKGILCATMAMMIWSSSFIVLKIALNYMPAYSIIFFRMLIATIVFLPFYKQFTNLQISKSDWKFIIFLIICEPGFYFIFETKALMLTSASQAGIISSTMPLITAVGAGIFLKEKITRSLLIGGILAMIGATFLSLSATTQEYAPNPLLGNFLESLAMVCAAGYTLSLKHLSKKFSAIFLTAIQAFGGIIFFLPLSILEWPNIIFSLNGLLAILYLGVVVTMGGYGLYNYALSLAPASKIASMGNLIPAFCVLLAFLILGETLNVYQLLATATIFLGVFISQKGV